MWEPKNKYPDENIQEYLPNVCPEQPSSSGAFCDLHAKMVENLGYPSQLRSFLEKCGANPNCYTPAGREKVKSVLKRLSTENKDPNEGESAESMQGVGYLLRNREIANFDNFQVNPREAGDCRKDIGEATRLHRRFFSVYYHLLHFRLCCIAHVIYLIDNVND